jgi:hypothetical protein
MGPARQAGEPSDDPQLISFLLGASPRLQFSNIQFCSAAKFIVIIDLSAFVLIYVNKLSEALLKKGHRLGVRPPCSNGNDATPRRHSGRIIRVVAYDDTTTPSTIGWIIWAQ